MVRPGFLKAKKGSIYSIIVVMIFIVVVGFVIIMGKFIVGKFYDQMDAQIDETAEMTKAETKMLNNFVAFDYSIVIMTVILTLGLIVTSFMIPSHPIFMAVNFIGIFMLVYLGMLLNNVFGYLVAGGSGLLTTTAEQFPKMIFLIQYLPYIAAILIFVVSIVMYSRGTANANY